jgi:hypothetical protein
MASPWDKTLLPVRGPSRMESNYNPPDPAKIDADNPEALTFWARTLETREDKIRQAVAKVGPMLEKVKQELGIGGV